MFTIVETEQQIVANTATDNQDLTPRLSDRDLKKFKKYQDRTEEELKQAAESIYMLSCILLDLAD